MYQDNYSHQDFEKTGLYQNQYMNRVYLTTKEGIYLQHHKAYMAQSEPLEVPDDIVLMDLMDKAGQIT